MSAEQIKGYYDFVIPLVKLAGKKILEAKDYKVETKGEIWDVVTVYDRLVEEILIATIKVQYPNHKFIGEEESSNKAEIDELTDAPTWIIDPIDGTQNFIRRFPITCISIGLTIKKEPVLGIIFNPFLNEMYTAIKGKGAFLNGKRIFTSNQENIAKCVMNYELSLARNENLRNLYLYRYKKIVEIIAGIRSLGCAALGLCYVASGIMDAYTVDGLYPWDVAAGVLIVNEAGGYVCGSSGGEFDLMNPNIVAGATKPLTNQIVDIFQIGDEERKAEGL